MAAERNAPKTLNIKDPAAHRLARELADETGESMTAAVVSSLRERLERIHGRDDDVAAGRLERMLELAAVMRERAPAGYFDQDFDQLLFDDAGLPK